MHGDSSTVMLCSVIFKIICYLLTVTTFYNEFTYQRNSVIKTTNTKKTELDQHAVLYGIE